MSGFALTPLDFLLVALGGFAAGFIDAIAGGGGMISMPLLLSLGLPPHLALGTNKLQSALGTTFAALHYARRGLVERGGLGVGLATTGAAAFVGAWAVSRLDGGFLVRLIPWLLAGIFVYVLVSPRLGGVRRAARVGPVVFHLGGGLVLGFYDGFFGPGTGSFWTIGYVVLLGLALPQATANTKLMNLTSNLASLAWFAPLGAVAWGLGLVMGVANIAGALVGSTIAIRRGAGFIRSFVLLVVGATIARLVWRAMTG